LRNVMHFFQNKSRICFCNGYCLVSAVYRSILGPTLRESSMSTFRSAACAAVLLVIAVVPHCDSQVLYGSLTGNVIDPASAAVPGVHIEATNQETNVKSETKTDD